MNRKNGASKRTLLVGASLVVALATASSVRAACSTDNGAITCTGDNSPLAVTSNDQVTIAEGATVTGSGLTAVRLASSSARLNVDGTISAAGAAGLTIQNGDRVLIYDPYVGGAVLWPYIYPYYYPAGAATIVVGEQGKISGDTGIWVERSSSNYLGSSSASVDNSGLITASSGSALGSAVSDGVGYSSITNRESGTIHGIAANVTTIDNAGLIDGRQDAAITIFSGFDPYSWGSSYSTIINSGTITSAGRATIESQRANLTLTNSGTIGNSAGGLAINALTSLYLTNTGTIDGDIVARAPSRIDSSTGTINGNVRFGDGDDILYAGIDDAGSMTTGINGRIDGGSGINSVLFSVSTDTTLTGTPVLPTNFSILQATLADDAKLTLDAGFVGTSTLHVDGSGSLINDGRFETQGTALVGTGYYYTPTLSLTNNGTIKASLNGTSPAVSIDGVSFTNNGTVEAVGGTGVALQSNFSNPLINNGTISATGGAAIVLGGDFTGSAALENKAGGVIKGDTTAIAVRPDSYGWSYTSTRISNAGTIIGNVDMRGSASTDLFIMQTGGSVEGDILLGDGNDRYFFNGSFGANGFLTGVSGLLDGGAGRDQLVTLVKDDAEIKLGNYINFEVVSLKVDKDRQVKLTGDTGGALLDLHGEGTVDLTLSLSGRNSTLIDASGYYWPGDGRFGQSGTSIINRGDISASFDGNGFYYGSAIQLDQLDRFTNEGSITLTQAANFYGGQTTAISAGLEVVNNGQILLNGGGAINSALTVVNNGIIEEVVGGAPAFGISSVRDLTNSGTIRVSGTAVYTSDYQSTAIRNSGTIQSTGAQAIRGGYASTTIFNEAGGTIAGGAGYEAIALSGGAVGNAGTINGAVDLAYSPYGDAWYAGAYVDHGGILNGDLLFGSNNDILVATSDTLGITGRIDAGDGIDTFIRSYTESRTVDLLTSPSLPAGFELWGVGASGKDTVVTLAASGSPVSQPMTLVGDGTIINLADFSVNRSSPQVLTLGSTLDPLNLSGAGSTLTFINRGAILGAVGGSAASFENEGTVRSLAFGMPTVQLYASDQDSFVFKNSGTITSFDNIPYYFGAVGVTMDGPGDRRIGTASIANGGTIHGGLYASLNAAEFSFSNDGLIERGNEFQTSLQLSIGQGNYYSGVDTNADTASISNSGKLTNGLYASIAAKALEFSNSGTIGSPFYGSAVSLMQTAHWTGDLEQGVYGEINQDSLTFTNSGTVNGSANIYSSAKTIDLTNSGTIENLTSDDGALDFEGGSQSGQTIVLANSGRISTDVIGASAVAIESYARSAEQQMNGFDEEEGPIDGEPTSTIKLTNSGTLSAEGGAAYSPAVPPPYPWYSPIPESLSVVAGLTISASSGGLSSIDVTNEVGGVISATGATRYWDNGELVAGLENIGSTAFLASANQISLVNAGTISGLTGGIMSADAQVELPGSDANFAGKFLAGAIQTINSTDRITNASTGVISGSVDLGALGDRMANYGTINGNVYLGEGDDSYTHGLAAIQNGVVDGGDGNDALIIDINGGGLLAQATLDKFVSFEGHSLTGTGTITTDGPLSLDSLTLRDAKLTLAAGQTLRTASDISIIFADGVNSLTNFGTIAGGLDLVGGVNSVVNRGSIAGAVNLGAGNNEFTVGAGSSVGGPVIAGGANDLLILATGGSDQAPEELPLSGYSGFERTRQDSGTIAFSGGYRTGELTVAAGRFIGRTGSVLDAGSIQVGKGATFGSAGTVNGNVTVQGTLSPGSSPGTMIVNGNVALAGGSTTLFEMTPTVSDALVINGALAIAPGSTLTLTGNRPLTPGATYQLITASGGISGSFTTIDKASTIVGFIRQGRQSIDLLGQFVLGSGANRQVTQTVGYLNGLLIAGTATSGVLNAASSLLLADGSANPAIIARLNAESYASASQIGIENGLAVASALRTASNSAQEDAGLFTFGQTMGGWRSLPGKRAIGTSRADVSTYGALAGIGFGSRDASIGAFIGYIDARQKIGALQARTDADGILAGIVAQGDLSGFNIAASLSYDGSKADTNRTLFGGSKVSSHYRLRSWTADIAIGHAFGLGDGWSLEPEVGFTHIASRRGGTTETGDAVWALDVQARRTKANFLRGALELHGSTEARISPWLSAGVLHQLSGTQTIAAASYVGVTDRFAISGTGRSETLATVGAGLNVRVSRNATLYLGGNGEFGAQSGGQSATIGYRIRF